MKLKTSVGKDSSERNGRNNPITRITHKREVLWNRVFAQQAKSWFSVKFLLIFLVHFFRVRKKQKRKFLLRLFYGAKLEA